MSRPLPPSDLESRKPALLTLPEGAMLHRFYTAAFAPLYFDRSQGGRLNAPDGSYGTLYTAETTRGAFAETFLRRPGLNLIDAKIVAAKAHVKIQVNAPLSLIQLTGPGLAIVGATAEVTHGGLPYDLPQQWSRALHTHPCKADGIAYRSRHDDDELCFALFDRASTRIAVHTATEDLDQTWFWNLMDVYSVGLAP